MRLVVTRPKMTFVLAYREAHIRETFDLFWMYDDPDNKDDGRGYVRVGGLMVQRHNGVPDRYYYRLCSFFANNDEAYRREEEWSSRPKAVARVIWMGMRAVAMHFTNIEEAARYGHYTTRDLHVYYKGLEFGFTEHGEIYDKVREVRGADAADDHVRGILLAGERRVGEEGLGRDGGPRLL